LKRDLLLERLRQAAPVRDADVAGGDTADLVAAVARSLAADDRPQPRRRRMRFGRRTAILVAAALALAATTTAMGFQLTARTGLFGNPEHTEDDGSEFLQLDAPDFEDVARSLVPHEIPLPPGLGWEQEIDRQVRLGREEPGLMQETGVRATFAYFAQCAWVKAWLDAHLAGDDRLQERATRALAASHDWAPLVAVDGGGVRDFFATRVAEPAARGEAGPVRAELAANCTGMGLGSAP
jgi:hypothetical protein